MYSRNFIQVLQLSNLRKWMKIAFTLQCYTGFAIMHRITITLILNFWMLKFTRRLLLIYIICISLNSKSKMEYLTLKFTYLLLSLMITTFKLEKQYSWSAFHYNLSFFKINFKIINSNTLLRESFIIFL